MGVFLRVFGSFIRFLLLRVIPLVLIVGIVWSGYQVAQAVVRQVDEQNSYDAMRENFPSAATAIAQAAPGRSLMPTVTDVPPTETVIPSPTFTLPPPPTVTIAPSDTATSVPPTETPQPTSEPTQSPKTEPTVSMPVAHAEVSTAGDGVGSNQIVFATNTPRSMIFATNTPPGGSPTETPSNTATRQPSTTPSATNSPTPSNTATFTATASLTATETVTATPTETASATATFTPTVTETATETPNLEPTFGVADLGPLPTPLFPQSVAPGTVINGIEVPTAVPLVARDYNLVNILLLGTDGELTNDGFERTDTMILVSINRDTGTVNMLSFPRDLYVYIPTTNGIMERLNVAYGIGESIGWTDGGFGLLRQTLFYNFGINAHYYAKVDFTGFKDVVDMLGGVDIAVDCAYQDYALIGAELPDGARPAADDEDQVIVDVGYYHLSGAQALWYARTRKSSTDFDRGRRQQQLLRAIWRKAVETVNLTNVTQLWNESIDVVDTDMSVDNVIGLLPFMLNLNVSRIESFAFIPTYHTQSITVTSDGVNANVQQPVYDTVSQLMLDFYRPPSESQLVQQGATVAVYNGSGNQYWDRVASERLQWEGYLGYAAGDTDAPVTDTIIIDHTGQQKGSSLNELVQLLNINPENVLVEPDPARESDFTVIVGSDYNSCNVDGVLDVGG